MAEPELSPLGVGDKAPDFDLPAAHRDGRIALAELGMEKPTTMSAGLAFNTFDGFDVTPEDEAEWRRPLQRVGAFLIDRDGTIRWAKVANRVFDLPKGEELLALV